MKCKEMQKIKYENELLLIELAEISYDKEGKQKSLNRFRELGFKKIKRIENKKTDTQVYIVSTDDSDNSIVVVFRGSESKRDWQTNLNFDKTFTKKGEVHQGFHKAMSSVFDDIANYIKTIPEYRSKDLFVTGHSLGGALSQMFSYYFEDILPIECGYSYGAPRVFSKKTAKKFDKQMKGKFVRVVNNNDMVTKVPLLIMGYRHIGKLIYLTEGGKVRVKTSLIFRAADRLWGKIRNIKQIFTRKASTRFIDSIDDHHPARYYNVLSAACGNKRKLKVWKEYHKNYKKK